ncbi:LLM class flavin-dependent oxidoreductase [Pantoea dispersa]|nr:LLM class flavin-dependent oxidoreductase [Pantoea dispersa]
MIFLIAIQPGIISLTSLAKMAVTLCQFTKGRVLLNVVSGDKTRWVSRACTLRYDLSDEFLQVLRPLLAEKTMTFQSAEIFRLSEKERCCKEIMDEPAIDIWVKRQLFIFIVIKAEYC